MSSRWLDTNQDFFCEVFFLYMDQEEVNVHKNAQKEQFPTKLTLMETWLVKTGFIIRQKQTYFLQEYCEFKNN